MGGAVGARPVLAWAGRTLVHLCPPRQQQVRTRELLRARPSVLIPAIRRAWWQAAGPTILEPKPEPPLTIPRTVRYRYIMCRSVRVPRHGMTDLYEGGSAPQILEPRVRRSSKIGCSHDSRCRNRSTVLHVLRAQRARPMQGQHATRGRSTL